MKGERGFILVLVLVILSIITALTVEFSYGLFATTSNLKNWTESQRLSLIASSGIRLASTAIKEQARIYRYTYPEKAEMVIERIVDNFAGKVSLQVEDEGGKINLNSLIMRNKRLNSDVYNSLKRLLTVLKLDQDIADRIVDWIDVDSEPRIRDSEEDVKNSYFDSIDELLLIRGIDRETYDKLIPHVTVYGIIDRMNININTASIPVIMSLSDDMTDEMAASIVRQRRFKPFEGTDDPDLTTILGPLKTKLMGRIDVKSSFFRVTSMAEEEGIKRVIDSVLEIRGDVIVRYWKEY
ncbi:MAG: type II secretion system minor pseudopilin GspK [Thermodesulfovibrionales bacterium]